MPSTNMFADRSRVVLSAHIFHAFGQMELISRASLMYSCDCQASLPRDIQMDSMWIQSRSRVHVYISSSQTGFVYTRVSNIISKQWGSSPCAFLLVWILFFFLLYYFQIFTAAVQTPIFNSICNSSGFKISYALAQQFAGTYRMYLSLFSKGFLTVFQREGKTKIGVGVC